MAERNLFQLLGAALGLLALLGLGFAWWRWRRKPSPAERERARRLAVNRSGRLTDGELIESPFAASPSQTPGLLFYRYSASGVEYTAAQDVSSLTDLLPAGGCRPGTPASVKYDPRRPSNSIVVCEEWSGLRTKAAPNGHSGAQ